MTDITITEADIEELSTAQSFQRGYNYYRSGAIVNPLRRGDELHGECHGSGYSPYQIRIGFDAEGEIEFTTCSCPYDWGGICKHRVALLLTWVHRPDRFTQMASLDEQLAGRSREELIVLIKTMIEREPGLHRLLDLPLQPDADTELDLTAIGRQISYALDQTDEDYEYGYGSAANVATELWNVIKIAGDFAEAGRWAEAGDIYALILKKTVEEYEQLYDEEGDVAIALQKCAEELDRCFENGQPDAAARRRWLLALLEAEFLDIALGGRDLAYPAGELVVRQPTEEEWSWIEQRIRAELENHTGPYSDWAQEALIGMLGDRLELTGQTEALGELVMETGTPRQQAFYLVEEERFDEAIALAAEHFANLPGLVHQFADALVEAGAGEKAQEYVAGLLGQERDRFSHLEWLAKRNEAAGNLQQALDYWRQHFQMRPSLSAYQSIRELSQSLDVWDWVRPELVQFLESKNGWGTLMDIALDEEEVSQALELLERFQGWQEQQYELKVARAAEAEHPQAAIEIYTRKAEKLINARGRDNYNQAAGLLSRVRDLYQRQGQSETWQEEIKALRDRHSNLPALQDELNKAGLKSEE